jgi:hypothetical protein
LYPLVGGTATTHKYNFMDARDLDVAFRLQFNGGWTHSASGILGNATNTYANTFVDESVVFPTSSEHISIYSRTNIDALYCDIGLAKGGCETNMFLKLSNKFYFRLSDTNDGVPNTNTSLGFFLTTRNDSYILNGFNKNVKSSLSSTVQPKTIGNIYIGAMNRNNTSINYPTARQYAFASIGDGLSDTDASNLYTLTQAFQTTLGRAV